MDAKEGASPQHTPARVQNVTPRNMDTDKKFPHLDPAEAQSLKDTDATEEQWAAFDTAAKNRINHIQASYQHGATNMTIVVTGTTGAGKSATANTILGRKEFKEGSSAVPVTTENQVANGTIDGLELTVIDTPGSWKAQLGVEMLVHVVAEYIVLLVINLACPRFGQNQLDELRVLQGPDGTLVLNSGRCVVVLTHADSALQQSSLTEYLAGIKGDPLHTFLTHDLKGNILAVNNTAITPYERWQQQRAVLNAVTKASLTSAGADCISCCGCRCGNTGCTAFGIVAAFCSALITIVLGMLIGWIIKSPFGMCIISGCCAIAAAIFVFILRSHLKSNPVIAVVGLTMATIVAALLPFEFMLGSVAFVIVAEQLIWL